MAPRDTALMRRRRFFHLLGLFLGTRALRPAPPGSIIDCHQHTTFGGRTDSDLIEHQERLGASRTLLLPAGRLYGLDARCGSNESCRLLAEAHPDKFEFFANEVADLPDAIAQIERYLRLGASGIGEQKFRVSCRSKHIKEIARLARDYGVPLLLHFEFGKYNTDFRKFHEMLELFPNVPFIGHAYSWWGDIDREHRQQVRLPAGAVTPGGYTDRLLSDFPNAYGDLSGPAGLNALARDPRHARAFLERHQDKLLFGSDCGDSVPGVCLARELLEWIRRLCSPEVAAKILHGNAAALVLKRRVTFSTPPLVPESSAR